MARLEDTAASDALGRCSAIAASISNQHRTVLESIRQVLIGTAAAPPLRDLNAAESSRVVGSVSETNQYFAGMAVADADGAIIASSIPGLALGARVELAREAMERGAFVVGALSREAPAPCLSAAAPIAPREDGASGALVAYLDMSRCDGFLSFEAMPEEVSVAVLDRDRKPMYRYRTRRSAAKAREGGPAAGDIVGSSELDADGDGAADIFIVTSTPRSAAFAGLRATIRTDILIVAAAVALSMAMALLSARRSIVARIAALVAAARRYERGDLEGRGAGAAARGSDELDALASAMDSMAAAVRSRELARRETEEDLRKAVAEREVLLREVHHRVYNGFQLVLSLMRLQAFSAPGASALDLLRASESRILAMALVHEKLYQSELLARVDISDYLDSALSRLRQDRPELSRSIRVEMAAERLFLDISKAIPFGLAASELVANSLEHAFEGREGGSIFVELRSGPEGTAVLEVRDDGRGIEPRPQTRGIGLQLARSLSEQLGGRLEIESPETGGTRALLSFPLSA